MDINDQKSYPTNPRDPTCANCAFFEPCGPEMCKEPDEDPHGFCYVEPPVYVHGGGARGVQTWASNRACRHHPFYLFDLRAKPIGG